MMILTVSIYIYCLKMKVEVGNTLGINFAGTSGNVVPGVLSMIWVAVYCPARFERDTAPGERMVECTIILAMGQVWPTLKSDFLKRKEQVIELGSNRGVPYICLKM
jgi:hypothetical protein